MLGLKPKEGDDERLKYQHQTILTPDRLDLELSLLEEVEIPTYDRVTKANRLDPGCDEFREAVAVRKKALNRISLDDCSVRDSVLYKADCL